MGNGLATYYKTETRSKEFHSTDRYRFGGKELDTHGGLFHYDFVARNYDPVFPQFTAVDPLAEKYPDISPYASRANCPLSAIDLDGNLVIFINGFHGGDGGSKDYWDNGKFADAVMNHLNDHHALYIDGSMGGIYNSLTAPRLPLGTFFNFDPIARFNAGFIFARRYIKDLIKLISDKDGIINEKVRIVSHSMGSMYAKGFLSFLVKYLKSMGLSPSDVISFEADFAPFQPKTQKAIQGISTLQFSHGSDFWAGNCPIPGATMINTTEDQSQNHNITSFYEQIKKLPQGNYKVVDGVIVPY